MASLSIVRIMESPFKSIVMALLFASAFTGNLKANPALAIDRSEIREAAPGELKELKDIFPAADLFSEKSGRLPHYKAYSVDAGSGAVNLIGFVFMTNEVEPDEFAYASSIDALVGLTVQGTITKVKILRHIEPFGYFSIDPPEFAAQFEGKSILDPFEWGDDVDAVTGATITVEGAFRVLRKSTRAIARQYLQEQKSGK